MSDKIIIEGLQSLQADATVFYHKLRHYHWHVHGPKFFEIHAKLETMYDHWAEVIDALAERAVMIGGKALPTMKDVLSRATLKEESEIPELKEMVAHVAADLEAIIQEARKLKAAAEKAGDEDTVAMLDEFTLTESKTLWMLRAFLK
ncbi:DNA starvation/stationary phase protection protein [candidate division KSB1 bacterium]|nr:MAG: DNA starvation/stationary phase protection protein [candidate division KSB1 bacterium]